MKLPAAKPSENLADHTLMLFAGAKAPAMVAPGSEWGRGMFVQAKPRRAWSDIGLRALIFSIVTTVALALADGILKGRYREYTSDVAVLTMLETWVVDFRYVFEQFIYAATIFFVGAKFFETRTIFTIGFDKLDSDKVVLKGPDENNVVWIGHRYNSKLEADAVAAAFAERLKDAAA